MRGANPTAVQSLESRVQSPRLKGWIRPSEIIAFAQRQLKVSLVCVLLIIALSMVGHRTFQSFSASSQSNSLSTPANVTATDNAYSTKVAVEWNAVRGATLYRIFRNTTNNSITATALGTTPQSIFFDATGVANQAFFYWVRAENGSNVSSLSESDQGARTGANIVGPIQPLNPPAAPPGNAVTAAKAYLGKALFWDEQLSSTRTVACGTCHFATSGGSDARSIINSTRARNPGADVVFNTADDVFASPGVISNNSDGTYNWSATYGFAEQVTGRKSRSYVDAGYSNTLFWDGRATGTFTDPIGGGVVLANGAALESQVLGPPVSAAEMAHVNRNWNDVAVRIMQAKPLALSPSVPAALNDWIGARTYSQLFEEAFGTPEVTPARIAMAIATFERTVYSDRTRFDQSVQQIATLSAEETRGQGVFNQSRCNVCHAGSLFSDNAFHNIGVRPPTEDTGRFQVTGNANNIGEFRTPSLRNVALRAPLMHNGRLASLEDVVDFYNRGGDFDAPNINRNLIRPLGLSPQQRSDLVAFLRTLTDARVTTGAAPFDRPMLYSESSRVPQIFGNGTTGTGGTVPQVTASQPPLVGNPSFSVGVSNGLGGAQAVLVIDSRDPGTTAPPASASFHRSAITLSGSGAGQGVGSVSLPIPDSAAIVGLSFYGRWYISDQNATGGFAVSPAFKLTIFNANTTGALAIDDPSVFVRQQYLDFLNREPEPGADGLYGTADDAMNFYLNILNGCGPSDTECIRYTRGALSANFFRSPEFQRKGNFVMYLYMVSIGQRPITPAELPTKNDPTLNDRPHFAEFNADLASISTPNDDPALTEQKKNELTVAWLSRTQLQQLYPATMSNSAFVQKLIETSGITPANQNWVAELNAGTKTRARVLREFAESPEVNAKFYQQSFVTMEYFGFLRRDPEDCHSTDGDPNQCGFIFHNNRFNTPGANPDSIENIIVRGFIESPEYRGRF
jgi:cytochrome c peroxidase